LLDLYYDEIISEDEAVANATSPDNIKLIINGVLGVKDKNRGDKLDGDGEGPKEDTIKIKFNDF
jgi:Tfp pilus assembly ATPase PilU